jgi:hypothetical protein
MVREGVVRHTETEASRSAQAPKNMRKRMSGRRSDRAARHPAKNLHESRAQHRPTAVAERSGGGGGTSRGTRRDIPGALAGHPGGLRRDIPGNPGGGPGARAAGGAAGHPGGRGGTSRGPWRDMPGACGGTSWGKPSEQRPQRQT